jgi:hypothetical protein
MVTIHSHDTTRILGGTEHGTMNCHIDTRKRLKVVWKHNVPRCDDFLLSLGIVIKTVDARDAPLAVTVQLLQMTS